MRSTTTTSNTFPKLAAIPADLLTTLRADIDSRQIDHGMRSLEGCTQIIQNFDPTCENGAAFLGILAEWIDLGFGDLRLVRNLIATYNKRIRAKLTVLDYIPLRMAEGMVAMTTERIDTAIEHFAVVLQLAGETEAWDVLAITNYWIARCHRKKGQYTEALGHLTKALDYQSAHGRPQNGVPARVLQSLILFENGDLKQAIAGLREAESILSAADDYVTRGNIQSTYGRILERELRFGQAIERYMRAIAEYKKRDSRLVNVARTIADMSFTRILVARELRRNIEKYPDQQKNVTGLPPRAARVKELSNLYSTILNELDQAAEIYAQNPNARGIARVWLYRGYLSLDMGELDEASEHAIEAFRAAESKRDYILLASVRNLQCMIENARVEEQVDGWINHAVASQDYAREAVELASNTQNRRLLAIVHIWQGLTLSNSFYRLRDKARESLERATAYLEPGVRDYIWQDYQVLRKRLLESTSLEPKLLQWAHGEIGEKTFRQLEEDFADLVIPRLWEEEKRKISRVASRLSVSPRKVRRVLARLGLMDEADTSGDATSEVDEAESARPTSVSKAASRYRSKRIARRVGRQR
jgi:tetratricopeptide (TPR) repeat protein